jgi:hypothetical protein
MPISFAQLSIIRHLQIELPILERPTIGSACMDAIKYHRYSESFLFKNPQTLLKFAHIKTQIIQQK